MTCSWVCVPLRFRCRVVWGSVSLIVFCFYECLAASWQIKNRVSLKVVYCGLELVVGLFIGGSGKLADCLECDWLFGFWLGGV